MADKLALEIDAITKAATDLTLTVVSGNFDGQKVPTVRWDTSVPSALRTYLSSVKNLCGSLAIVETYEFNQEVADELRPKESKAEDSDDLEGGADSQSRTELDAKWEELISKYAPHYGSLYAFELHSFREGIHYIYEREASWYLELTKAADDLKEELESLKAEAEEDQPPELTEKEIERFASELARDEVFQKAKNQNARRFAMKKKFPQIVEDHPHRISEIIDHAKGIFELEIQPEMERGLDNQIQDLARQGLTQAQISKRLKLSPSRVRKAL